MAITELDDWIDEILKNFEPIMYTIDNGETFSANITFAEAKAAIQANQAKAEQAAELYGRLHQVIELFQQGQLTAKSYSALHSDITDRIAELHQRQAAQKESLQK